MSVWRCSENPIIAPRDVRLSVDGFEVIGAFNAAVARIDEQTILLMRVAERPVQNDPENLLTAVYDPDKKQIKTLSLSRSDERYDFSDPRVVATEQGALLTSISHLRIARSGDGVHFEIEDKPAMAASNEYECYGLEDPRVTRIGDTYYVTYVAVSAKGIVTMLAETSDFKTFSRRGIIFGPDNKDVVLFPETIGGHYWAMHRPSSGFSSSLDMWMATSPDLIHWGQSKSLLSTREDMWDCARIGAGGPPFKTRDGWVKIYHGADANHRYCLGAVLLDLNDPLKVLARSAKPILTPDAEYEQKGFFGQVVFSCGQYVEKEKVHLYYGASDAATCYATVEMSDIFDTLE